MILIACTFNLIVVIFDLTFDKQSNAFLQKYVHHVKKRDGNV